MKKKGLYIHIPFCRKKCAYCDFYSVVEKNSFYWQTQFANKVITQFHQFKEKLVLEKKYAESDLFPFSSIYFGGGSPSYLQKEILEEIVVAAKEILVLPFSKNLSKTGDIDFTIEANPEDINSDLLTFWSSLSINRISLGVQSLSEIGLRTLGRNTSLLATKNALQLLKEAKEFSISTDLICGWTGQTKLGLISELRELLNYGFNHISLYNLSMEEGTPYYAEVKKGKAKAPNEEIQAYLFHETQKILKDYSFERYEISNYARRGFHSKHNILYWLLEDYLGFGPSSHSLWNGKRYAMPTEINLYLKQENLYSMEENFSVKKDIALSVFRFTIPIPMDYFIRVLEENDFILLQKLLINFTERGIARIVMQRDIDKNKFAFSIDIFKDYVSFRESSKYFYWNPEHLLFHNDYILEIYSLLNN